MSAEKEEPTWREAYLTEQEARYLENQDDATARCSICNHLYLFHIDGDCQIPSCQCAEMQRKAVADRLKRDAEHQRMCIEADLRQDRAARQAYEAIAGKPTVKYQGLAKSRSEIAETPQEKAFWDQFQ
jgi:hypothetical protein